MTAKQARWLAVAVPGALGLALVAVVMARAGDPAPDRIVLTPVGDPTVTAAVTWRSPEGARNGSAQIAVAPAGPDIEKVAKTLSVSSTLFATGTAKYMQHSVVFANLRPETTYAYRVANGTTWSEWFQFRTASTSPKPFRFIYLGDEQTAIRDRCSRVLRQALVDCPDARLILHAGDLTNTASSDSEWGEWFSMGGRAAASILQVPAIGNHQYEKVDPQGTARRLTPYWRAQFTLPANGVAGVEESSYTFDYQGVRFVVLNSMEKIAEQTSWLGTLLTSNPCRWTVVMFHHPLFSGAKNRDNKELREAWKPVLDRHQVDLVLTGHDHVYGRSNPSSGPAAGSTVYVTSVTGTKQYDAGDRKWAARFGQDLQLYQIIGIDGDRLTYEARTADGTLYDAFEMIKRGGRMRFVDKSSTLGPETVRKGK